VYLNNEVNFAEKSTGQEASEISRKFTKITLITSGGFQWAVSNLYGILTPDSCRLNSAQKIAQILRALETARSNLYS
jgi:hypothetical protein